MINLNQDGFIHEIGLSAVLRTTAPATGRPMRTLKPVAVARIATSPLSGDRTVTLNAYVEAREGEVRLICKCLPGMAAWKGRGRRSMPACRCSLPPRRISCIACTLTCFNSCRISTGLRDRRPQRRRFVPVKALSRRRAPRRVAVDKELRTEQCGRDIIIGGIPVSERTEAPFIFKGFVRTRLAFSNHTRPSVL